MAINRKLGTTLFTLGGVALGLFLGWMFFSPKKNSMTVIAGKPCTMPDGTTKGKTDDKGVCKA